MIQYYQAYGFNIRSEIKLPELLIGDMEKTIDIDIQYGHIPETLSGGNKLSSFHQVKSNCIQVNIDNTARYQALAGSEIIVHPLKHAKTADIRLFLLGTVLGGVLHQRKTLPLHASTIIVNDQAIAFTGHSGAGKSTLAANFHRRGYPVMTDDVCAIRFDAGTTIKAYGSSPRIKLWADTIDHLGIDKQALVQDKFRTEKYHISLSEAFQAAPVNLNRIYLLDTAHSSGQSEIIQLSGIEALTSIIKNTYQPHLVPALNVQKEHFVYCAKIANQVSIYRMFRPWGKENIEPWLDNLERHWSVT